MIYSAFYDLFTDRSVYSNHLRNPTHPRSIIEPLEDSSTIQFSEFSPNVFFQETVGEPFFLLLCAIKQQINKGSIDAITGKARYTLNEEWLLRENIEAKPLVCFNTISDMLTVPLPHRIVSDYAA